MSRKADGEQIIAGVGTVEIRKPVSSNKMLSEMMAKKERSAERKERAQIGKGQSCRGRKGTGRWKRIAREEFTSGGRAAVIEA
jgi:hypothetical protein